jgi:type II secretory pathway pseudopilin PulG
MRSRPEQAGFTYLALLFAIAFLGVGLALAAVVASIEAQREREAELLFAGAEFKRAFESYSRANAKLPDPYPQELEALLKDPNHPGTRRHLRRIHVDPMTGSKEWGLVRTPSGGIMGVYSLSQRKPLQQVNFPYGLVLAAAERYSDWRFVSGSGAAPSAQAGPGAGAGAEGPGSGTIRFSDGGGQARQEPRTACDILNGADQGYCRAIALRRGPAVGGDCLVAAAKRLQICRASPKGPFPPLP